MSFVADGLPADVPLPRASRYDDPDPTIQGDPMIPASKRVEKITVADYLRMEWEAEERHNYLDGVVFPVVGPIAMAGESGPHADITANLVISIGGQLKGKACRVRTKDTKVRSGKAGPRPLRDATGMYSYPDVVVVCGEPEYYDDRSSVVLNPAVIVEVLSPSTEAFDRGEKFARLRRWNPTLTDYLLVSQDKPRVEHYTRQPRGRWLLEQIDGLDSIVAIASIGVMLRLADVFDRVAFSDSDPDDQLSG